MNDLVPQPNRASTGFKYWAFISYGHADEEWAKWLHKSLETYRAPRKLVGRSTPQGEIPKRLIPIFRDRDELPGSSDLGGRLKDALSQSRSLIVICSPNSAGSKWVNEEVKTYKALGLEHRVFCLVTDGEPNAAPNGSFLECFPPAVKFRIGADNEVTNQSAEPIVADVRPGKDGKTNALFKLISGILGVGYDELKQREKRRQRRRRLRLVALSVVAALLVSVVYVGVADAGMNLPAGAKIRTLLDRHNASVLRPVHSNSEIRAAASSLRREFLELIKHRQTPQGHIAPKFKTDDYKLIEHWSSAQALSAAFRVPELNDTDSRQLLKGLDEAFATGAIIEGADGRKYGWIAHPGEMRTQAEPAIWTATALANALGRPGLLKGDARDYVMKNLAYTQEVLKTYRSTDNGGWNMFPNQLETSNNVYTTTLALLALLETRKANLPWEGSVEKRDKLLKVTAQWLADRFDDTAADPGWRAESDTNHETIDGLTLQIYGELLRAEAEAEFAIPPRILKQMPDYLARCGDRNLDFPNTSGEFIATYTDHRGIQYFAREALSFLWYPWAIDAAQLWLLRAEKRGEPMEEQVRVRRTLGNLVIEHGDEAVQRYKSEWTYHAAETLYGLSSIPQ